MTFETAARIQHNRSTYYTVWLVGPNGEREQIGVTQRKSGNGLIAVLKRASVQARLALLPGAETATFTKTATCLTFSNGWRLEFGDTICQESTGA